MTFRTITSILFCLTALVSCSSNPEPQTPAKALDTSDMTNRERAIFDRMLDEMYAPCTEMAVTLDACLQEERSCKACEPAAKFLAARVKEGLDKTAIRASYKVRFGGEAKNVDVADSPTLGPANAPVTIVVWSDFECPHCKHVIPIVEKVAEAHPNDVRLVHKFYPLPRHTNAKIAARAAWAAKQQGKYWEMERLIFENQNQLGEQTILGFAAKLGLDMDRIKTDMESEGATGAIERDVKAADDFGLTGTPFILINGREFDLRLFQPEPDLDSWVSLEIEIAKGK